jgi:hypothetical protein
MPPSGSNQVAVGATSIYIPGPLLNSSCRIKLSNDDSIAVQKHMIVRSTFSPCTAIDESTKAILLHAEKNLFVFSGYKRNQTRHGYFSGINRGGGTGWVKFPLPVLMLEWGRSLTDHTPAISKLAPTNQ